jgi:hypothetical protein
MRRVALWLVALPLILAGTECAHALAYRIVYPQASVRWQVLAETGHGYMGWAPLVLGIGSAVVLAGLASIVADTARRRAVRPLPAWAFGSLPLVAFFVQEFLERWFANGVLPWWLVEQPTFRIGLLLQLPFAVLAYLAARLLLRAGRALGRALGAAAPAELVLLLPAAARPAGRLLLPLPALGRGWSPRGPPLPSV